METESDPLRTLEIHPAASDRWEDMASLFGGHRECAGCWCMYWRVPHSEFKVQGGEGLKQQMKTLVSRNEIPGLLAYVDGKPAGWVSLGPRENYPTLESSKARWRVDDQPVWSVVCFFIAKPYRRGGLSAKLLAAAVEYARSRGAKIIEGYPVEPRSGQAGDTTLFSGLAQVFLAAGFKEVARRAQSRPFMRLEI
jgi:GNAT superfamily N-acetyltransferase